MAIKNRKLYRRNRIKMRIRKIVVGSQERPRLAVYRSNKQIYVQLIDDNAGNTMLSVSSALDEIASKKGTKIEKAQMVGSKIAEIAKEAGIESVIFDRGGYLYHGRIKALAESARKGGLKF